MTTRARLREHPGDYVRGDSISFAIEHYDDTDGADVPITAWSAFEVGLTEDPSDSSAKFLLKLSLTGGVALDGSDTSAIIATPTAAQMNKAVSKSGGLYYWVYRGTDGSSVKKTLLCFPQRALPGLDR